MDRRTFIRSRHVVLDALCGGGHRRLVTAVGGVTCYWIKNDDVLHTGASKKTQVFIFLLCVILGHGEHCRILLLLFLDHTTVLFLPGYFVQETRMVKTFEMIYLVRIGRFAQRPRFRGYLVYLLMLPCCILYRSIVWQCCSQLIYIDKQP